MVLVDEYTSVAWVYTRRVTDSTVLNSDVVTTLLQSYFVLTHMEDREIRIIKANEAYPNLDFTVDRYIEEFEPDADPEEVLKTIEESEVLDHWGEGAIHIADWKQAMELLSEHMDSVEGAVGEGNDFDEGFDRCWFDIEEDDKRDSITIECEQGQKRWEITFEAENIDIRHTKIFENKDEEIEEWFPPFQETNKPDIIRELIRDDDREVDQLYPDLPDEMVEKIAEGREIDAKYPPMHDAGWAKELSEQGDSFKNEFINVHIERLDDACYFIGGDDAERNDVYHKVWLEPDSDTMLRYKIHFDN